MHLKYISKKQFNLTNNLINKYDKRPKNEFIKDIANKRRKYRLRFKKWILLKR